MGDPSRPPPQKKKKEEKSNTSCTVAKEKTACLPPLNPAGLVQRSVGSHGPFWQSLAAPSPGERCMPWGKLSSSDPVSSAQSFCTETAEVKS